ncbi:MAG: pyridoxamine 5'-phosphate oxidase family protein [Acidimicrobiales bacterium]|nr:pyridoxamine 5'-phosphate oxidase family protein [Acidimicrobiales bacterium]HRW39886.1 pyridoxamine 5'-phosphate oxidase family protein [Aquihabitans sp.]
MSTWSSFEAAEPELAGRARALLTATTNCVLGTLRANGSPRLSGIDPFFVGGELHLGSMPGARKAHDLQRDPRLALHGVPWESRRPKEGASDPGEADAKLTGRAVEIPHDEAVRTMAAHFAELGVDAPAEGHLFRVDLETVVVVFVEDDELVIDRWSEAEGRVTVRRG